MKKNVQHPETEHTDRRHQETAMKTAADFAAASPPESGVSGDDAPGSPEDDYLLGCMYFSGSTTAPDKSRAVDLVLRAATQGHALAQYELGCWYLEDVLDTADSTVVLAWIRDEAANGCAIAQFHLALAHANGRGMQRDEALALRWLQRAAYGGEPMAQCLLSRFLIESNDASSADRCRAMDLLAQSAAQGLVSAQELLSTLVPHMH